MKKDWKHWTSFILEVLPYIKDEKDREIVKKRLTKKMTFIGKILSSELKELKKSLKKK